MRVVAALLLLVALVPSSLSQDPFAWLYNRRGHGFLKADNDGLECPEECDCPPTFPVAMYCDGRGLTAMPSIPGRMKYLYLQNNAISAVPDSAMVNATNLVWLLMQHNQLASDAIGEQVSLRCGLLWGGGVPLFRIGCV